MSSAKENYDIAIKDLVHRPGISPLELVTPVTIRKINYFLSNIKKVFKRNLRVLSLDKFYNFQCSSSVRNPQTLPLLQFYELGRFWFGHLASQKWNV